MGAERLGQVDLPEHPRLPRHADHGAYLFRGVDVGTLDLDQLALLRRHYLGFVFQGFNLLARTSALENVELPLIYRRVPGGGAARARARRPSPTSGLAGRERHTPAELSGGQQQRVAIARAIVTEPAMLLADEPTGNLDSARKVEIMKLLVELNRERGITIVMVTHEPDMAEYASRIVVFKDGVVRRGSTEDAARDLGDDPHGAAARSGATRCAPSSRRSAS